MADEKLPQDVMVDILSSLHVKSLMRFKCLSKSYLALITDPIFIKKHFELSKNQLCLLAFHFQRGYSTRFLSHEVSDHAIDLELPQHPDKNVVEITPHGPSNGILCLHISYKDLSSELRLWNPSTRELKVLPSSQNLRPTVFEDNTFQKLMDCNIAVMNDSIAYVKEYCLKNSSGSRIEIWVMNEYGVPASWNKRYVIGPGLGLLGFLGFWKEGEILVGMGNQPLFSYNPDAHQLVEEFPIQVAPSMFHAFRYVESIFPISVLNEETQGYVWTKMIDMGGEGKVSWKPFNLIFV